MVANIHNRWQMSSLSWLHWKDKSHKLVFTIGLCCITERQIAFFPSLRFFAVKCNDKQRAKGDCPQLRPDSLRLCQWPVWRVIFRCKLPASTAAAAALTVFPVGFFSKNQVFARGRPVYSP